MALPGISEVLSDGNLNLVQGSAENAIIKMGVCTGGTPLILTAFGTQNAMTSALGVGSLVENLSYELNVSGGPVLAMPLLPSIAGALSAQVLVQTAGSGTGIIDGYAVSHLSIVATISTGGALGVGKFTISVNSGLTSAPILLPSGGTYLVPGTYCVITFGAGTYVASDTYTIGTSSTTVTHVGSGSPTVTCAASPIDNYSVTIVCTTAGAAGTAQGTYSLDGYSVSPVFVFPSGSNFPIPNSGLALAFGSHYGNFAVGDTFTLQTTGPSFSNTDVANAFTSIQNSYSNVSFSMVNIIQGGASASAANADTQASQVSVSCEGLFTNYGIDCRAIVECPTLGSVATVATVFTVDVADTDAAVASAFVNLSAPRVCVCAGDALLTSPFSGLTLRRNASWLISARLAGVSAATDAGWVGLGGVGGVVALYRDEFLTPALDSARFSTLRTLIGDPGFFITNAKTMASLGSDFAYMTNARVIDKAALRARQFMLPYINSQIPITTNPAAVQGSISLAAAKKIDAALTSALLTSLVNTVPQDAVAAQGIVDTNHNVLSDGILPVTVSIVPFAYSRNIVLTIGFTVAL